jgi:hypothetical protein
MSRIESATSDHSLERDAEPNSPFGLGKLAGLEPDWPQIRAGSSDPREVFCSDCSALRLGSGTRCEHCERGARRRVRVGDQKHHEELETQ